MTEPNFAFEKKIGMAECMHGNIRTLINLIGKLLVCMQETNKSHGTSCEFFRLDFRSQYFDEEITQMFPIGALILDLKWGSKEELEKKKATEDIKPNLILPTI